ncbi:winged helix-turn-helix domain-containing protein [Halosegnis rubeus]|uniref:MarR family transcriptional regulator n=1 Tax=Halosegnis rubeus TaxID=2212850 RepID=A0A5N5UL65_9EURY|nr:winged helix-turn-helix domain-containing protein [Halosegnis rubeus]KAB7519572.1 MarR family transcriptional regulator [Halosegnis rubeus]
MYRQDVSVDITKTDELILDLLEEGRCTQGYIVDKTGRSRQQIHNRLNILRAAGYVERVHESTALYELVENPRS